MATHSLTAGALNARPSRGRAIVSLLLAAALASACGTRDDELQGGGAAEFDANGNNVNENLSPDLGAALPDFLTVRVVSDTDSLVTGDATAANLTVFVTNDANGSVADAAVTMSSDRGLLQNVTPTTDENGEATATLQLANDYRNQDITVQVNAGTGESTALIKATGSEVTLAGTQRLSIGDSAEFTATLLSGAGSPIANEAVVISSEQGHTIDATNTRTNTDGEVSFTVTDMFASDVITVSALEGTTTMSAEVEVVTDLLNFSGVTIGEEIAVGDTTDVVVTWTSSGNPIAGESLRGSLTAGQLISASELRTNGNGQARFTILSNSAGPATFSVTALNGAVEDSIDVEFIATVPSNLTLTSEGSQIPTLGTAILTATVTDANGNLVKNQEVSFASTNLFGGQLSPGSSITNSEGVARTTFTAGNLATQFEELNVSAQVVGSSAAANTQLTIIERVLNLTIGTSNQITERALGTQYGIPFVVQVADGGGSPLNEATVELSVRPLAYRKGYMTLVNINGMAQTEVAGFWEAVRWESRYVGCIAEDINGNRLLDAGEDNNANGVLDPQDPSLLGPIDGGSPTLEGGRITTDATGTGLFELIYPASSALWADVEIVARAPGFGVEAEAKYRMTLPILASVISDYNANPANHRSPYGVDFDCSNEF